MNVARMMRKISPFAIALLLLCLSGIAATVTIVRLHSSEAQVNHTYTVEVSIGDVESALADVGRNRVAYISGGTAESLEKFRASTLRVAPALARIRQLTIDNPAQQSLCGLLETNANQRIAYSAESVDLKLRGETDPAKQFQITSDVARAAFETAAISFQMRQNEDRLLESRSHLSRFLFTATLWILVAMFSTSAFMFWVHYRLLNRELRHRRTAENHLRRLSGDLMRVQDDERKKFARELHDGLGQNMVAAKMAADLLLKHHPDDPQFRELSTLLDESLLQTRTISYLLHPPLLEELGLVFAAKWLIEGYTRRTGVEVSVQIPAQLERLPRNIELALFRILQEALTNIHMHSKSKKAEVLIQITPQEVMLLVRDFGKGIPAETLSNFEVNGTHVGVGLAGMRERIQELGGKLKVRSDSTGTEITVKMQIGTEVKLHADALVQ
jgi:signal transduction histidine kinase